MFREVTNGIFKIGCGSQMWMCRRITREVRSQMQFSGFHPQKRPHQAWTRTLESAHGKAEPEIGDSRTAIDLSSHEKLPLTSVLTASVLQNKLEIIRKGAIKYPFLKEYFRQPHKKDWNFL